jgi:phosphoglycerate kinase
MRKINKLNLKSKKVLLRVDFNVPIENGKILDDYRIKVEVPVIKKLMRKKAKIILISHLGRPEGEFKEEFSLKPIKEVLEKYLKRKVLGPFKIEEVKNEIEKMKEGEVLMLENIRFYKGEIEGDENFAKSLAELGDLFINDAFSVCHRDQASVTKITKYLPSFAGPNLISEIKNLSKILKRPKRPLVVIIGGKKVEDKAKVVEKFSEIADFVLVGNLVANEIKEGRVKVKKIEKVIFPIENKGALDIDPKTIEIFKEKIRMAKTVFWAGPLGKVEEEKYQKGTLEIVNEIGRLKRKLFSVVGGGDTIEFLNKFSLLKKFDFVSIGGGAMLDFLAGEEMPGLKALGYYGDQKS